MQSHTGGFLTCGHCGTPNAPGEQFCINCGYTLAGPPTGVYAAVASSPAVTGGGRRLTGALSPGVLLSGRYRIVALVGKGGFGAVYKALDLRFSARRQVAIKEMGDALLTPSEKARALADFRQEADLLVQLQHPNLPNVSDFFEEAGKAYLVMEFIEGKTLAKILEEHGGPLDEATVMGWGLELCAVLHYLHTRSQAIIFRDMKPANVMLTPDGQLKLIDFGIARIFKSQVTRDTTLLGSQGYAPLEQYGRSQSDARSDIYALGATLYELLTGELPLRRPDQTPQSWSLSGPARLEPAHLCRQRGDHPDSDGRRSSAALSNCRCHVHGNPGCRLQLPGRRERHPSRPAQCRRGWPPSLAGNLATGERSARDPAACWQSTDAGNTLTRNAGPGTPGAACRSRREAHLASPAADRRCSEPCRGRWPAQPPFLLLTPA
ncbi:serine/threonine-protein kinase [Thermogemmatispora tikiterensis]|uniref:serine/threonine-protein kinase n=1 Tax=Thermogemmatispora tikiterensis TaxID=1825093 RepID=UPI0021D5337C|nr:serine/threonine-protein kinase [Thermogemmatispora tikiterensis]